MGQEIPIARSHSRLLGSRFRNTIYGYLSGIWNVLIPTQQVGHPDFSDTERPQWSIYSYSQDTPGQYQSCSISSRLDIAIEAVSTAAFDLSNNPIAGAVAWFIPPASYIPWGGGVAPVVYWVPGIRPRYEYDLGNTFVTSGSQVGASPLNGWWSMCELSVGNNASNNVLYFNPPLILPATMFLTAQFLTARRRFIVNWRYREIG